MKGEQYGVKYRIIDTNQANKFLPFWSNGSRSNIEKEVQ